MYGTCTILEGAMGMSDAQVEVRDQLLDGLDAALAVVADV